MVIALMLAAALVFVLTTFTTAIATGISQPYSGMDVSMQPSATLSTTSRTGSSPPLDTSNQWSGDQSTDLGP
jgi:hypothetical protein